MDLDGEFARVEMLRSRHYKEWGWSSHINSLAEKHGSAYHTMRRSELDAAKRPCWMSNERPTPLPEWREPANSVGATNIALRATAALVLNCRKQGD
jgi:hypothetical protein